MPVDLLLWAVHTSISEGVKPVLAIPNEHNAFQQILLSILSYMLRIFNIYACQTHACGVFRPKVSSR